MPSPLMSVRFDHQKGANAILRLADARPTTSDPDVIQLRRRRQRQRRRRRRRPARSRCKCALYKVKGNRNADLTWSGATGTSVVVHRNGSVLTTTQNDGPTPTRSAAKAAARSRTRCARPARRPAHRRCRPPSEGIARQQMASILRPRRFARRHRGDRSALGLARRGGGAPARAGDPGHRGIRLSRPPRPAGRSRAPPLVDVGAARGDGRRVQRAAPRS